MTAQFPAYQHMISRDDPDTVRKHLEQNLRFYKAEPHECVIEDMSEVDILAQQQGFKTRYKLRWTTYRGWKVYMLCTGCFASDPKYEGSNS